MLVLEAVHPKANNMHLAPPANGKGQVSTSCPGRIPMTELSLTVIWNSYAHALVVNEQLIIHRHQGREAVSITSHQDPSLRSLSRVSRHHSHPGKQTRQQPQMHNSLEISDRLNGGLVI